MNRFDRPADAKCTILVLDDDAAVRDSLKFSLGTEGFDVHTYSDFKDLLNDNLLLIASCLIIDCHMPTMDGLEVVAKIRDRRGSVPVILVTGHPNANIRERATAVGVALIEKPFRGNLLVDCIRAALPRN